MCRSDPATTSVSLSTDHMCYIKIGKVSIAEIFDEYWTGHNRKHVSGTRRYTVQQMKAAIIFV
jgi:hypothetical protein